MSFQQCALCVILCIELVSSLGLSWLLFSLGNTPHQSTPHTLNSPPALLVDPSEAPLKLPLELPISYFWSAPGSVFQNSVLNFYLLNLFVQIFITNFICPNVTTEIIHIETKKKTILKKFNSYSGTSGTILKHLSRLLYEEKKKKCLIIRDEAEMFSIRYKI